MRSGARKIKLLVVLPFTVRLRSLHSVLPKVVPIRCFTSIHRHRPEQLELLSPPYHNRGSFCYLKDCEKDAEQQRIDEVCRWTTCRTTRGNEKNISVGMAASGDNCNLPGFVYNLGNYWFITWKEGRNSCFELFSLGWRCGICCCHNRRRRRHRCCWMLSPGGYFQTERIADSIDYFVNCFYILTYIVVAFYCMCCYLENPYEGALAIVVVYIVATILFVPASILTLGAGYAFGTAFDNVTYGVFVASMVRFVPIGTWCQSWYLSFSFDSYVALYQYFPPFF